MCLSFLFASRGLQVATKSYSANDERERERERDGKEVGQRGRRNKPVTVEKSDAAGNKTQ